MNKATFFILLMVLVGSAHADEKDEPKSNWTKKGATGVNLSQASYSNWSAGGVGSFAYDLYFNYGVDYSKDKHLWQNRLELAYGQSDLQSIGTRKTNDKIFLSSMYGYKIATNLYASATMTFNTQFAKGYDYGTTPSTFVSNFMAPGYLSEGVGLTWTPKKWFKATLSPATWRGTFVMDDELSNRGAFGVTPGKHLLSELGANLRMEATYEFLPNMTIYSRLDMFSNYLKDPQNVVVNWENQLSMKINKWFSAQLNVSMIYDDKIRFPQSNGTSGARLQVKEVLGVGMMFTF